VECEIDEYISRQIEQSRKAY